MTTKNEKLQKCRYSRNLKQTHHRAGELWVVSEPHTWLVALPTPSPRGPQPYTGVSHTAELPSTWVRNGYTTIEAHEMIRISVVHILTDIIVTFCTM